VLANTSDLRWIAILLGSADWVEEMHTEWADARPTHEHKPGQSCVAPKVDPGMESVRVRTTDPPGQRAPASVPPPASPTSAEAGTAPITS
ncbi:MAG: hypothetical protein MUF54_13030, partial [Polyangiaceae bacterium]|nr:hypothetical protein [Polyangiaceae bacterium]